MSDSNKTKQGFLERIGASTHNTTYKKEGWLLGDESLRAKYFQSLPSKSSSASKKAPWRYKEICFLHRISPIIKSHFDEKGDGNRLQANVLKYCGCQSVECGKLKSEIEQTGMIQLCRILLSDIPLCFGNKNSKMTDLCFRIYDKESGKMVAAKKYRCLKMSVGGIKRSTQPKTQRNIIASAAFSGSRLFFELIHSGRHRIIVSIGIRGECKLKTKMKKMKNSNADIAAWWFLSFCSHGIIEEECPGTTGEHRILPLLIFHQNKFVGDMAANLSRFDLVVHGKNDVLHCEHLRMSVNEKEIKMNSHCGKLRAINNKIGTALNGTAKHEFPQRLRQREEQRTNALFWSIVSTKQQTKTKKNQNGSERFQSVRSESVESLAKNNFIKSASGQFDIFMAPNYLPIARRIAHFMRLNANKNGQILCNAEICIYSEQCDRAWTHLQSSALAIKENGVYCKVFLPQHTVIAIFFGFECLENEFSDANDFASFNLFALHNEGGKMRASIKFVLNCKHANFRHFQFASFINHNSSDYNTDLMLAYVNGWPHIFFVTRCDIRCGTELRANYRGVNDDFIYRDRKVPFWRGANDKKNELHRFEYMAQKSMQTCINHTTFNRKLKELQQKSLLPRRHPF